MSWKGEWVAVEQARRFGNAASQCMDGAAPLWGLPGRQWACSETSWARAVAQPTAGEGAR